MVFILSSLNGHAEWFHSSVTVTRASIDVDCRSLCGNTKSPSITCYNCIIRLFCFLEKPQYWFFSYWVHRFIFSPTVNKGSPSSASSSAFISLFFLALFCNLVFFLQAFAHVCIVGWSQFLSCPYYLANRLKESILKWPKLFHVKEFSGMEQFLLKSSKISKEKEEGKQTNKPKPLYALQ